MVERIRVRCRVCRTAAPLTVLWAIGDTCPRCSEPMYTARQRPAPDGVLGKAIALLHTQTPVNSARPDPGTRRGPEELRHQM